MIKFKCRASAAHSLMTDPKNKADKLSQTSITYIETWYKEKLYGRRKEFTAKQTDKGNVVEEESIEYAAKVLGWAAFQAVKNEERFENDWLTGIPDLIGVDMKNSYDCFGLNLKNTATFNMTRSRCTGQEWRCGDINGEISITLYGCISQF